ELRHASEHAVAIEPMLPIALVDVWRDIAGGPFANRLLEQTLFVSQVEIDHNETRDPIMRAAGSARRHRGLRPARPPRSRRWRRSGPEVGCGISKRWIAPAGRPSADNSRPFASHPAAGANRSRPSNVRLTVGRAYRRSVSSTTLRGGVSSSTTVSTPLSGATNLKSPASAAMPRRDDPTPGSTTTRKIAPAGMYR